MPAAHVVDAVLAWLRRGAASGRKAEMSFSPEDVSVDGRYGFLVSTYRLTLTSPTGSATAVGGRSMLIFKRGRDGQWRIWRDMDNRAPDAG